jgi:hypothetical protein
VKKHNLFRSVWTCRILRGGKVISEFFKENALVDQGELLVLNTFFRGLYIPDHFFVGLAFGAIGETSTIGMIPNEPSGNGYARQTLTRDASGFTVLGMDEGDYYIQTKTLEISASGGNIGPINKVFMGAELVDGTQFLVSYLNTPTEITIYDGDTFEFSIKIKAM